MPLEIFCHINGIGAASGIVYTKNQLYLVSDSSAVFYRYAIENQQLHSLHWDETLRENLPKKEKPDFEILTQIGNELHLMGSGSTSKRNLHVIYNLDSETFTTHNQTDLYERFKNVADFSDDELNLEGAFFYDKKEYYFQRGNGRKGTNGIFIVSGNDIRFHPVSLPKIKNVETTFTDAFVVDDKAYFLAAAEDTDSTYNDGAIMGSLIGSIDLTTMLVEFTELISNQHKLEGLTLFQKKEGELVFLICEDNDTEVLQSTIYRLVIRT